MLKLSLFVQKRVFNFKMNGLVFTEIRKLLTNEDCVLKNDVFRDLSTRLLPYKFRSNLMIETPAV